EVDLAALAAEEAPAAVVGQAVLLQLSVVARPAVLLVQPRVVARPEADLAAEEEVSLEAVCRSISSAMAGN
ncbi:MAG TPA: hypothetical protein VMU80_15060, partial [Bryobacteraceae bacterium]|nr:hypothetical protein [Bryobacteraceae bacterium]